MPDRQLQLDQWLPYKQDRNASRGGRSFYFFDLDDNILYMDTRIFLFHKESGKELAISSGEMAENSKIIGKSGPFKDYTINPDDRVGSFRQFRDHPISLIRRLKGEDQFLCRDLQKAVANPAWEWQGPSWNHFFYAVLNRRPISIITARGHQPKTFIRALNRLTALGFLPRRPNYLSIYPVTNPKIRKELGDVEMTLTVAELKRLALKESVKKAFKLYGENPHHRFGVSDDDPANLLAISRTLAEIKRQYRKNAFFVIDTSGKKVRKTEIFEDHQKASADVELADVLNYQLFDF